MIKEIYRIHHHITILRLISCLAHRVLLFYRDDIKKDDSWFQYYYDVVGYPHPEDSKKKAREHSNHLKNVFGVRSLANIAQQSYLLSIIAVNVLPCIYRNIMIY